MTYPNMRRMELIAEVRKLKAQVKFLKLQKQNMIRIYHLPVPKKYVGFPKSAAFKLSFEQRQEVA